MKSRSWTAIFAVVVVCAAIVGIVATHLSSGLINKDTARRIGALPPEKLKVGTLVLWQNKQDGNPKTYSIGNLILVLKLATIPGTASKSGTEAISLQVTASGEPSISVTGDVDSYEQTGIADAIIGAGRFDRSNPTHQIIFSTFSGGNHPAAETEVLELIRGQWKIIRLPDDVGGIGVSDAPKDVNGDGIPDFVLSDERFVDFWSGATGYLPNRVFNIRNGALIEVSDSPAFSKYYLSELMAAHDGCVAHDGDKNAACAAYVADAARIGQFRSAWQVMLANYDRTSTAFVDGCKIALVGGQCPDGAVMKFNNYPQALAWILASYSFISQAEAKIGNDPALSCNNSIREFSELFVSSPFTNTGHCYRLPMISVSQWIDEKTAIATTFGNGRILVDFTEPPTLNFMYGYMIVQGEGAYQYQSVIGALSTVPRVKYLGHERAGSDAPASGTTSATLP